MQQFYFLESGAHLHETSQQQDSLSISQKNQQVDVGHRGAAQSDCHLVIKTHD